MNSAVIHEYIRKGFSKSKEFIATLFSLPYAKTYITVSIILFIFFAVILFPYGIYLKGYFTSMEIPGVRSKSIGALDFSLVGPVYVDDLDVTTLSGDRLIVKTATAGFSKYPWNLYSRRLTGPFQLAALQYQWRKGKIITTVNGNADIILKGLPQDGYVTLIGENTRIIMGTVELPQTMGGFSITVPEIRLSSLQLDLNFSESGIAVDKGAISGPSMQGTLSGRVYYAPRVGNARLELELSVHENSAILREYKELLLSYINKNHLTIIIRGTVRRPVLSIKR